MANFHGRVYISAPPLQPAALKTEESLAGLPASPFEPLIRGLEQQGLAVQSNSLPVAVAVALKEYASGVRDEDYHAAQIGRGLDQQRDRSIRKDRIHWLEGHRPVLTPWREWTEALRLQLNRELFLGLFSFESHLAHYRPGDFYRSHRDAFQGEANRIVSLVCYLNEDWSEGDGGELMIYAPTGTITVQPRYRTVVLFLSEEILHEVRPAKRDRHSVTGWFRLNSSSTERVDPPR
jgi:SM-20-related protein